MNYTPAKAIADRLVLNLRDRCERIEIAGSLRRFQPDPKDIEIVCIPKIDRTFDMFGDPASQVCQLESFPWGMYGAIIKCGERYKQVELFDGINLDLFIVLPPAEWGVIMAIRTGPADFSRWLVTKRKDGGALPSDCYVADGAVVRGNERLAMPEETDFLNFCGLGWIEPEDRKAGWPR